MNGRLISAVIVGAAVSTAAVPVNAFTCYEIIDRNNVVILRDVSSPVDLSDRGAAAREAMRNRGELLVIYETQTCVRIERGSPTGGRTLTTDEIVAGWRSFGYSGFGGTYGSTVPASGGGGAVFAPMPTNVGPTPAAQEAAAVRRY
jgi:hypothetical protein